MPRTLSLLLLLCWAWSQAFAAGCPMAPPAQPAGPARAHAAHATHPHHASADERSHRTHLPGDHGAPAHHASGGCALATACGAYAVDRPSVSIAHAPLTVPAAVWPVDSAYLAPVPSTDPPPPRRLA
jgi:hypothetical protein